MVKTVRKGVVKDQDLFRRQDMEAMSPSVRLQALVQLRDRAFPYEPLRRVALCRIQVQPAVDVIHASIAD